LGKLTSRWRNCSLIREGFRKRETVKMRIAPHGYRFSELFSEKCHAGRSATQVARDLGCLRLQSTIYVYARIFIANKIQCCPVRKLQRNPEKYLEKCKK